MSAPFGLGDRVTVAVVYQWPPQEAWEDLDTAELAAVPNERAEQVAVVVGVSRRKCKAEVRGWASGENDGVYLDMLPSLRTFYVVRYTLRGRRYLTLAEHMTVGDGKEAVKR